ncbi:MAG: slipin family protein [Chloroflexi bacterium]|nr:slipin family protein [Chloroflexota bacterium]
MQKKSVSDSGINPINPASPLRPEKKGQQSLEEAHLNGVALFLCIFFILLGVGLAIYMDETDAPIGWTLVVSLGLMLMGFMLLYSLRMARQWEKAVVLRLGKFHGLRGPGLFWLMPLIDSVTIWVDQRVMVTPFSAEKTLTRDTVPVNVDAVLFWVVWDAEKAALEVENYKVAIAWAAQTALREVIGQMTLADILIGRNKMDADLQKIIDERTTPWGITVQSVEIRDVIIPQDLEDAMSRQAQAERERQSRIILGESEKQIASSFAEASAAYVDNPTALHLRAMNMLFEGLKQKGALVIVPSSAVDTMNLGGMSGLVSLAQNVKEMREKEA